jgi:small nuclear ribonucleoprotein (snRNP)-like protein
MNVVLDSAAEVTIKGDSKRRELGTFLSSSLSLSLSPATCVSVPEMVLIRCVDVVGRILLKGDNITLIQPLV